MTRANQNRYKKSGERKLFVSLSPPEQAFLRDFPFRIALRSKFRHASPYFFDPDVRFRDNEDEHRFMAGGAEWKEEIERMKFPAKGAFELVHGVTSIRWLPAIGFMTKPMLRALNNGFTCE